MTKVNILTRNQTGDEKGQELHTAQVSVQQQGQSDQQEERWKQQPSEKQSYKEDAVFDVTIK